MIHRYNFLIIMIFVFWLHTSSLHAAQESKTEEFNVQEMLDAHYRDLGDAFTFLHSQGVVQNSLYDFVQSNLIQEDSDEVNFGEIMQQALNVIELQVQGHFIHHVKKFNRIRLNRIQDPIFDYIMQHKDTRFWKDIVNEQLKVWVHKSNNNIDETLSNVIENGHAEIAQILIDAGANINIRDSTGFAPIHHAMFGPSYGLKRPCAQIVQILMNAGADINIQDENSSRATALIVAAAGGYADVAQMLIYAGAHLNIRDRDGETAMHMAARQGRADIVQMLMNAGADLNIQNRDGRRAQDVASTDQIREILHGHVEPLNANITQALAPTPVDDRAARDMVDELIQPVGIQQTTVQESTYCCIIS